VAYFGGMNITDVSSREIEPAAASPTWSAAWRDVHVRLEGPQQAEIAESFDRSWRKAQGEAIANRTRRYRQGLLMSGRESIQFFDSGPGRAHTRAGRVFSRLIRAAHKSLTFSMAYFLPVGRVHRSLLRAHRRGVFVRVVVPGASDVPVVQRATHW